MYAIFAYIGVVWGGSMYACIIIPYVWVVAPWW